MICRADRQPPDVLIADEDPVSREILQHSLECLGLGLRVQAVSDGYTALRAFSKAAWIECVILDARMPGPCPQEMLDQLQRINPSVPVLFCSALADTDPSLEFIPKRRSTLLMKPYSPPDLCQALISAETTPRWLSSRGRIVANGSTVPEVSSRRSTE